ncbi:hypothetical protein NECAME_16301 [Necator americanus]|uniref:Uncharacterized protein n=1 Tax=Necator americanus TaxID=51031 RepID=W2TXD2_NECAM|nr:hypothetical protein NECAME_16301 [Necator americanus]ETN86498.1 hypothetical protein NECAME_16301 [Necator americanus]
MEGIRREKPMAFEKHIPLHHHSLDMKKNYTAMFVTPQQYAKLAATAHGEETEAMSASLKKSEQSAKKKHRTKPRDRSGSALTAPTQFSVEEVGREDDQ